MLKRSSRVAEIQRRQGKADDHHGDQCACGLLGHPQRADEAGRALDERADLVGQGVGGTPGSVELLPGICGTKSRGTGQHRRQAQQRLAIIPP